MVSSLDGHMSYIESTVSNKSMKIMDGYIGGALLTRI